MAQTIASALSGLFGEIQGETDIDCRDVFTTLTSCRETYELEAESNQGVTRAEGHLRGRRVATDASTTTVYELDARIDCLTIQPFAASAGEPGGVDIWASGPVRKFTMNGKSQPIPGGNTDAIVHLRRASGVDGRRQDARDDDRRADGLASLMYAYVSDGCTTMPPLAVTPRASIELELKRARG